MDALLSEYDSLLAQINHPPLYLSEKKMRALRLKAVGIHQQLNTGLTRELEELRARQDPALEARVLQIRQQLIGLGVWTKST